MRTRNVTKTWGTWYTGEGERADAWPEEVRATAGAGVRTRDALVSSSVHGLAGGGPGLGAALEAGLLGGGEGGPFGTTGSLL
jgi:hypothetical protein